MPSKDAFDVFERQSAQNQMRRAAMRVACMLALSLAAFTIPAVGANRQLVGIVLSIAAPVPALLVRYLPPRFGLFGQSCFDIAMACLLSWFIPEAWAAALVVVSASPAASAAITGKRFYSVVSSAGLVGMLASALGTDAANWLPAWVVAVVLVPVIASYVDVYLSRELSAAAHLSDVVDSTAVLVWEIDPANGEFMSAGGRVEDILGIRAGIERNARPTVVDLVHPDDLPQLVPLSRLPVGGSARGQARFRHTEQRWVWLRFNVKMSLVQGRRLLRGVAVDVSELIAAHDETRWRAERDQLTGLANRSLMLETLSRRLTEGERLSFFMLDLDGFKDINDTLGHGAGDLYLQAIGHRLATVASPDALVARLGGDEFAVVSARTSPDEEAAVTTALLEACQLPVQLEGVELSGAVSIGIAHAPEHGDDPATIMRRADVAMYAAKRSDRSAHLFDLARDEPTGERLKLSGEIERALTNSELRLWFQPKVHLSTGKVIGAEGLLRWHHPSRGLLMPADFIDLLELSRHNRPLAQDVIAQGIAFAAAQRRAGHDCVVSVNVSMRNLLEPDLADRIASMVERADLPAERLVLEVTEREIADDRSLNRSDIGRLRALGVGLSIDDFGTGHSSLVRLQQMPVTELKIDQRFVAGLGVDPDAPILVRSIVELCRNLGLACVAEGVERPEQARLLLDLGCEMAQGFFFSRAVPDDSFGTLQFAGV